MKKILAITLLLIAIRAQIVAFDNQAVEKIFQNKKAALFLFISDNEESTSAHEAFKAFDETSPQELILTVSSKNDGHGLYDRLGEYLGIDSEKTPTVLYLNSQALKFRYDEQLIQKDKLASFVERVQSGKISPFLKSASIPETNDEPVKVIVGDSFKQIVLNSKKQFLIEFYAPWCGHCKQLAPEYEKAAVALKNNPNIVLAKVDSTENQVSDVEISGFPTLKFWTSDKSSSPIEFNGDRNYQGIIKWLKEHTSYDWVDLEQQDVQEGKKVTDQEL